MQFECAEAGQHGGHEGHWVSVDLIRQAGPNFVKLAPIPDFKQRPTSSRAMSAQGQLETFPALSRMSVAGGKADAIGTKADVGLECLLLRAERT